MDIRVALHHLDPSNNDHWTADGAPRIDAVSEYAGEQLTRAMVTNAAPDFTRETAQTAVGAVPVEEPSGEEVPSAETHTETNPEAPTAEEVGEPSIPEPLKAALEAGKAALPEVNIEPPAQPEPLPTPAMPPAPEPTAPKPEIEVLQDELLIATTEMYDAQRIQEKAKVKADAAANRVNALNRRIELLIKVDPNHGTAGVRAYLAQQNINRQKRHAGMQRFVDMVGVKPKDVQDAMDPKAPIDRAMGTRKPQRGAVRPTFTR